jgi:phage major head subunit gpT-like protein
MEKFSIEHFLKDASPGLTHTFAVKKGPITFNAEERTVDVIFTRGTRVFRGDYFMELSLDDQHVRMGRLRNGAPVLDNHDSPSGPCGGPGRGLHGRSLGQIGVVEKAELDARTGEGRATLRFSKREAVNDIFNDVKDGIIRNISMGFMIYAAEEIETVEMDGRDIPVFRAVDWEPFEISPVQAGADDDAKIRSTTLSSGNRNLDNYVERAIEKLGDTIADKIEAREIQGDVFEAIEESVSEETTIQVEQERELDNENPIMDTNTNLSERNHEEIVMENEKAIREEAVKAEQERVRGIREAVEKAGLERSFADELTDANVSVDEARSRVIDKLAEKSEEKTVRAQVELGVDHSAEHTKRGLQNAWLNRANANRYNLDDHGKDFAGLSLVRSAAAYLETIHGVNTRLMPTGQIVHRALSTSDFPELLADTMNKSLRDSYAEAPQTFSPLVRRATVADFKQISRTNYGDAPALEEVKEHGAVKLGKISEDAEKYEVKTYAKKLRMTRKMLINDDLDAFVRTPAKFGRAARSLESDLVWAVLAGNGGNGEAMSDGNPLFDASHNNIGVAGALDIDEVGELLKLIRLQKGLDGEHITLSGSYLIGPVALEAAARQFFGATAPTTDGSVNPFKGQLQWISEPRLDSYSATRYYVAAGADQVDTIEIAYLEGSNGQPMIETRNMGGVEGIEVEAIHDFGVKAIDYRGLAKNDGA